jgi:pilus assembly protein FimV
MRESLVGLLAATVLLLQPALAHALALSDVQLGSALNQTLDARVDVLSATPSELSNLTIAASTVSGSDAAQIPLKCELRHDAKGNYIRITSDKVVREPSLKVQLQVDWAGGSLSRDYALLLDPR